MIDFNLNDYKKSVLPDGEYAFHVSNPELKNTKKNDGSKYLEIKLTVISAYLTGGVVFKKFNIYNASETAQRIAREQFAAFCGAIGMPEIKAYSQVDGAVVKGFVSTSFYGSKPKNEVDKFTSAADEKLPDIQAPEDKFNDAIPF